MKKALVLLFYSKYNSIALRTNNKIFDLQLHNAKILAIN